MIYKEKIDTNKEEDIINIQRQQIVYLKSIINWVDKNMKQFFKNLDTTQFSLLKERFSDFQENLQFFIKDLKEQERQDEISKVDLVGGSNSYQWKSEGYDTYKLKYEKNTNITEYDVLNRVDGSNFISYVVNKSIEENLNILKNNKHIKDQNFLNIKHQLLQYYQTLCFSCKNNNIILNISKNKAIVNYFNPIIKRLTYAQFKSIKLNKVQDLIDMIYKEKPKQIYLDQIVALYNEGKIQYYIKFAFVDAPLIKGNKNVE